MFAKALLLTLSSISYAAAPGPELNVGNEPLASATGATESHFRIGMTRATLDAETGAQLGMGRQLVDIEMSYNGAANIFSGVWKPVNGIVFPLFEATESQYDVWRADMVSRNGRFLDIEITVVNGAYRFNGLFLQDGNDYEQDIRTRRSESAFRGYIADHARDGYQLIDIEVGPNNSNGATIYSGTWVRHPNQPKTAVLYDLRSAEFVDLLSPLAGRVLDIETYSSDLHGETRYAIIFAMVPGATWRVSRNITQSTLTTLQNSTADGDTYLIDLDQVPGTARYDAVWGEDAKSLRQVPAIAAETNLRPRMASLTNKLLTYETGNRENKIGVYARNLTTGASVEWRMDEYFPLASMMKIPVHFRFWNAVGNNELNRTSVVQYTQSLNHREDWFCGDPNDGRLNESNFGQSFTLDSYSSLMMSVSDNAATAILVDHPNFGVANLNNTLNEWLAGMGGVGQGWGPQVSIHDVDRLILQHGQAREYPNDESLFLAPPWAMEARFRSSDPFLNGNWLFAEGVDTYMDLATYFGGPSLIPGADMLSGHERFHDSGFNAATPRGVARLYQAFLEDNIVPATVVGSVLSNMGETDILDRHPSFPNTNEIYSKGGGKGDIIVPVTRVETDSAMLRIGDDWFVFAVLGKHLTYTTAQNRSTNGGLFVNIAYDMLRNVAPNLSACADSAVTISRTSVSAGTPFTVSCEIHNDSDAPSPAFQVDFRLSSDPSVTTGDPLLGVVTVQAMAPDQREVISWQGTLPAGVVNGTYRAAIVIDRSYSNTASGNGSVGEWLESRDDNGALSTATISVGPGLDPVFANDFE